MLNKPFNGINLEGLIFYYDQGWQYQPNSYKKRLKNKDIKQRMAKKGYSMNNKLMKNFFEMLKPEMFYNQEAKYKTLDDLINVIYDYIYCYNHDILKEKLKGMAPENAGYNSLINTNYKLSNFLDQNQIVLIKKANGPYKGKLDLPGGTIEFGETPENTLIREIKEEVGINVKSYSVFDNNSVIINWNHKGEDESLHHIGMFYKINSYSGALKQSVLIDKSNDDSLGAKFYDITKLSKSQLFEIAILEINKLGYTLKE